MSANTPTADVYAGDTAALGAKSGRIVHVFTIEADAEPGTFARIVNVLNIANVAPRGVSLVLEDNESTLSIQVELAVSAASAQSIQRKLTQLTDVIEVGLATSRLGA